MPNQHTSLNSRPRKYRVLDFVRANPNSTTAEIAEHFGLDMIFISADLHHLKISRAVISERIKGRRLVTWTATDETDDDDEAIKRIFSQSWTPHHTRCPLVAALFGMAPAQVAA